MEITVFLKTKDGADAKAVYNTETKECIVKKNSVVSSSISNAPTFKSVKSIKKQRDEFVKNNVVIQDAHFKSSSSAGNFVTGRITDGMHAWKDINGAPLKNLVSSEKDNN